MYAEHFPLENVRQNAFCRFLTFCKQNVRAASLFFAKQKTQHFCIKCIFASNAFLHQQNVRIFVFCKAKNTAFLHQMHFCIKCIFAQHLCFLQSKKHSIFAQLCFALQKYIFASNTFLHQIHFCTKCIFATGKESVYSGRVTIPLFIDRQRRFNFGNLAWSKCSPSNLAQ